MDRVYNIMSIIENVIGYLPTIHSSASNMSTVHEILVQSKKVMDTQQLQGIVCMFDQALYAKSYRDKMETP